MRARLSGITEAVTVSRKPASFALGAVIGATSSAGAAMLLYTTRGFLGTAGFLVGVTLGALGLGLSVATEASSRGRRWLGAVFAYAAAAGFALIWTASPEFRKASFAGAVAVFFLLAEPAYAAGALFRLISGRDPDSAVAAFLGSAVGVLAAALFLIPRLPASVIFLLAAAVLLAVALIDKRRTSSEMETPGLSLNGKTAIVTGVGDRGQAGFAIASALAGAGARVCITSLHDAANTLAGEISPETVGVQCDLSNEDDVARLMATAMERLGRIDILVNVAGGLSVIKRLADTTRAEWEREITRNAETVFLVSRAALPQLRSTRGAIINFAAPAGLRAAPQLSAYSAAKAGVVALTRALAIEEKGNGVRVNALAPGMIDTKQNRQSLADAADVKWVTRAQIANVVVFLASDAASGITGETIHVLGEGIA